MENRSAAFAAFVVDRVWQPEFNAFDTCIELGAGTGRFTPPLIERFDTVHLVEPAPSYATTLQERFTSDRVHVSGATAEDFLDAWADDKPVAIAAFHLLHHISAAQRHPIFAFIKRTNSRGIFVEPNPWNPLIPLQILITPAMRFAEERQLLRLKRGRIAKEIADAGLTMTDFKRIVALPPGITDRLLRSGLKPAVQLAEMLTHLPCAASYQSYQAVA